MADNTRVDFSSLFNIQVPEKLNPEEPILVVEDQQDLRLIVVHQLQKLQFTKVRQAANGYDALDVIKESESLSAIICDQDMPVIGGLELLAELRERTDLDRPPFCLAMNNVNKERLMLAVENGVDQILAKPFTLADIFPKVQMAWKKFHNPRNPEKIYELAKSKLRDNDLQQAEKIYRLLADSSLQSARPLVGLARVAAAQKQFDRAIQYLAEAELRNSSYVHLFASRGEIYSAMGLFDDAFGALNTAIDLSPLNPIRYRAAADILFKRERYSEAITLLEKAIANGLEFKELHHYLSQAYFAINDYAKALRYVKLAIHIDPENVVYLNQMGICYKNLGQFDEATAIYNQIIKIDQSNIPALYNKALLCEAKGDVADAIKLLDRAVKKDPKFTPAINKLNDIRAKLNRAS